MIDGEEVAHEAQLWEETTEEFIIERDHTAYIYNWLSNKLRLRSTVGALPERMPESVSEVSVQIMKDGEFGQILFSPLDSLADGLKDMEVQVVFEYYDGFMRVGMGEAYTLNMLLDEFNYLTRESWLIFPLPPTHRREDGSVVHGWTDNWRATESLLREQMKLDLPPRIVEDNSRGALIWNPTKQAKILRYWSWIQQEVEVGVFIPAAGRDVEYWWKLVIPFESEAPDVYFPNTLMDLVIQHARLVTPEVAQLLSEIEHFAFQTRYAFNRVRVWYCPRVLRDGTKIFGSRIKKPLAEESIPKDKWFTAGPMAYTTPPIADDLAEP
jgi:hypothetical protein